MKRAVIESPSQTIVVIPKIGAVSKVENVGAGFNVTVFMDDQDQVIFRYRTEKAAIEGRKDIINAINNFYVE